MTDINMEIKSTNILRAYNEAHATEAAATTANPVDVVKDILILGRPSKTREIAKFYTVGKGQNNVVVPVQAKASVAAYSSGTYGADQGAIFSFQTITCDQDYGVPLKWNRVFAEQANWDVMGPFVSEGLGACEENLMGSMVAVLANNPSAGNTFSIDGTLSWANFVTGITKLAEQDLKCDKVLVSPTLYGELLQLQQFVDASYMGTDSNIASGILRTQLGVDIIMTTKIPGTITAGTVASMIFIDSTKALGVAMKRDGKVEEFSYPDTDVYGLIVSQYYGIGLLSTLAVALGFR